MDKKLLIGLGGIAAAGLIGGGVYLASNEFDFLKQSDAEVEEERRQTAQKIDDLYFEELKNTERYSFCVGKEKITGTYKSTIMGGERGEVNYSSDDISLFDKEQNRIYVLGRTIDYQYNGEARYDVAPGVGTVKIKESGQTTEYYQKNTAPLRLDYSASTLFPAPERKQKDWVAINTDMFGAVMSASGERNENDRGDAKTFCLPVNLNSRFLASGFSADSARIAYNGDCDTPAVNDGVSFSGRYNYTCDFVDYGQAFVLMEDYRAKESASARAKEMPLAEQLEMQAEDEESRPSDEEMRQRLEELRTETQADVSAQ